MFVLSLNQTIVILVMPIISIVESGKILETPRNSPPHPPPRLPRKIKYVN